MNELALRPRRRAHHHHLRAAVLIIFVFAPPRSSSSSSRRRAHHLICAAALIILFAPPRSSSSLRRRAHNLLRAVAIIMLPPLDLHLFGGSRHRAAISSFVWQRLSLPRRHSFIRPAASPRRHLFICLAGASIAAPLSFQWAGESHRRAAFFSEVRRLSSPNQHQ